MEVKSLLSRTPEEIRAEMSIKQLLATETEESAREICEAAAILVSLKQAANASRRPHAETSIGPIEGVGELTPTQAVAVGTGSSSHGKKRKANSNPEGEKAEKVRREKHDTASGTCKPEGQQLCHNFKAAMNQRTSNTRDAARFADAVLPVVKLEDKLPVFEVALTDLQRKQASVVALGQVGTLHMVEQEFCKSWGMEYDVYRCQKARIFLGLAFFAEYNQRKLLVHTGDRRFRPLNASKAQAQQFGNIDANKLSSMMAAFEHWGWVVPMNTGAANGFKVPDKYLRMFPQRLRNLLIKEVAKTERQHIHENQCVVLKLLEEE